MRHAPSHMVAMVGVACETNMSNTKHHGVVEPWSPEQQTQELTRRMEIAVSSLRVIVKEKPTLKISPDDILVVVPQKNGTTWLLHICHQIRMKGEEPTFENQAEVVTHIQGQDKVLAVKSENHKQPASPYIYMTQTPYPFVPEGGRRIFCFREPKDVVVSAYHYMDSFLALKGRVALPIFAHAYLQTIESQLKDLVQWWEHRNEEDMLLVFFDDLKEDHAGTVRQIAKFMRVELDDDAVARVVHTTSHAEMSRIASKFDVHKLALTLTEKIGEEPDEFVGRVRKDGGKSGEGKQKLPADVQQRIDQMWQDIVTSKLGFQNLKEMRETWMKELK